MKLCCKFSLLILCCFLVAFKSFGQVEFSGLIGPAIHYASVKHAPDSTGAGLVRSALTGGIAVALKASIPMQHGFRLNAGIRLLYKNMTFEQDFKLPWATFENHWHLQGFALETPVNVTYLVVDRKYQITFGVGMAVVKNWLEAGHTGISGSGSTGSTFGTYYVDIRTSNYQPRKNSVDLAGELSMGITPSFWPRFSLEITGHQDFLKNLGRITYENKYEAGSNPHFISKGSFGIERPGYVLVQLKYTFAGKPKAKEVTPDFNSDFEEDGSE